MSTKTPSSRTSTSDLETGLTFSCGSTVVSFSTRENYCERCLAREQIHCRQHTKSVMLPSSSFQATGRLFRSGRQVFRLWNAQLDKSEFRMNPKTLIAEVS